MKKSRLLVIVTAFLAILSLTLADGCKKKAAAEAGAATPSAAPANK